MKKLMRNMFILVMAAVLLLGSTALAETVVSPVFRFPAVQERPTEEPTAEPTAEPTVEPVEEPTAEPTAEPTPEPTAEPTPEPTPEPLPELELNVYSNLDGMQLVTVGTEMVLTLTVDGAGEYAYTIQWQQSTDGGATWTDIPGANAHEYRLVLDTTHTGMYWRANVDLVQPAE